jgi:hypothetical protein
MTKGVLPEVTTFHNEFATRALGFVPTHNLELSEL